MLNTTLPQRHNQSIDNYSEQYIDDLLINGNLSISGNMKWVSKGQCNEEVRIPVKNFYNETTHSLTLIITRNKIVPRYSIALLLGTHRIRCLCPYNRHSYYDEYGVRKFSRSPHKHIWKDKFRDEYAYDPDDITNTNDLELTFKEFAHECHITVNLKFERPKPCNLELSLK